MPTKNEEREDPGQLSDPYATWAQVELEVAHDFLDLAEVTHNRKSWERNMRNARQAHDRAARLMQEDLTCTESQWARLRKTLAALDARLAGRR